MKFLKGYSSGYYEEKKSKFIAECFPVASEDEVNDILKDVSKKHYNARHHCYAYVIGDENEIMKQSDDGEPSRTAGLPILSVITGNDVHNILMIVSRYFGGTFLGTGGLVRAYTESSKDALLNAEFMQLCEGYMLEGEFDYTYLGKLEHLSQEMGITVKDIKYLDKVKIIWLVPEKIMKNFENSVNELCSGSISLAKSKHRWYTR